MALRGCIAALVAALAVSCAPAGPRVVVYVSVDQVYAAPILRRYEERTGVRVLAVYDVEAAKATGLANRLLAERPRPQADVFWNGEIVQTLRLREGGALAAYRSPSAAGLPAHYVDPDGYWAGTGGRARVLLVNTSLVAPADYPASLYDLLDPKWPADRVGIALPLFGTSATHAAALYAALGPERALELYRGLAARGVRVVDGNSVVRNLVASGELMIGLADSDDACTAIGRGAPVAAVLPDQSSLGTLVVPGTVALVAGGPNPAEGRALVDDLLAEATERELVRSGFAQSSLREGGETQACLPNRAVRALQVDSGRLFEQLERSRTELTSLFVR